MSFDYVNYLRQLVYVVRVLKDLSKKKEELNFRIYEPFHFCLTHSFVGSTLDVYRLNEIPLKCKSRSTNNYSLSLFRISKNKKDEHHPFLRF